MEKESLIKQLKERGLKLTPQRRAIIDVLIEKRHLHPGAALVYREGKNKTKGLSLSTVYATLNEFCRQGLIKMLDFDKMENRYELSLEEHVNLICKKCGHIIDFRVPFSINQREIAIETGFQILVKRLEYYGHCRDCVKKGEKVKKQKGKKVNM
jgi:Fe2+ or Zn2+ uptake regulation protein